MEYFSFIISPVTFKDLTLKNLTMQDGSTFPYWVQRAGQDITGLSPQRVRVWVKCLFLQLPRFLGEGITHKVDFLHGWSQVLSKKTKQNKTNYSWILKREHQGTDKHVWKEYQIIDIFNLFLHVSLKLWCPLESILSTLGYPIHSPGIKYHLYTNDSFTQPRITPMPQTQYTELLDSMGHWVSFRHLET